MQRQSVHGHEIIHRVECSPGGINLAVLEKELERDFGEAPRFHTCSGSDMDFAGACRFLVERDKIRISGQTAFPGGSPSCEDPTHRH